MKFFFPDSMDLVDPTFDFENETRSEHRVRHQDDRYAHEVFETPPYDGLLLSKATVDGIGNTVGKYSAAQTNRFKIQGVRRFFRLDGKNRNATHTLQTMGDCGAFTYVKEDDPPYSLDEVIEFYDTAGFDYGVSMDHAILGFNANNNHPTLIDAVPEEWRRRQEMTLQLAQQFLAQCRKHKPCFEPVGIVQGWSPTSYSSAFNDIQKMGYRRVAIGGLVALKTGNILSVLNAINDVRHDCIDIHLFGVTGGTELKTFARLGVTSFDSTSPLRRAFKDDKENYYSPGHNYTAIRVPLIESTDTVKKQIAAGQINQDEARRLEQESMVSLARYDRGEDELEHTLDTVMAFNQFCNRTKDYYSAYKRVLEDKPWKMCACKVCKSIGIHVILFRGSERNRRRGFHNLYVFERQVRKTLAQDTRKVLVT